MARPVQLTSVIFLIIAAALLPTSSANNDKKLYEHLLHQLEEMIPYLRPVLNESHSVDLSLFVELNSVLDVNEVSQTVTVKLFMQVSWKNEYINWNPADFGGVDVFYLPKDVIWHPQIEFYSRVEDVKSGDSFLSDVWIYPDGTCLVSSNNKVTVFCPLNMASYPADIHKCEIRFASWKFANDELRYVDIQTWQDESAQISGEFNVSEFKIDVVKAEAGVNITYTYLYMYLEIQRYPQFLYWMMFTPMGLLFLMSSAAFFLPANLESKAEIQLSVMLSFAVYALLLTDQMPPTTNLPMAGRCMVAIMCLNVMSLFVAIFTINLSTCCEYPPPQWLLKTCESLSGVLCCIQTRCCRRNKVTSVEKEIGDKMEKTNVQSFQETETSNVLGLLHLTEYIRASKHTADLTAQWMLVATVIDRLYFFFVCFVGVLLFSYYLSVF